MCAGVHEEIVIFAESNDMGRNGKDKSSGGRLR